MFDFCFISLHYNRYKKVRTPFVILINSSSVSVGLWMMLLDKWYSPLADQRSSTAKYQLSIQHNKTLTKFAVTFQFCTIIAVTFIVLRRLDIGIVLFFLQLCWWFSCGRWMWVFFSIQCTSFFFLFSGLCQILHSPPPSPFIWSYNIHCYTIKLSRLLLSQVTAARAIAAIEYPPG